MNGGKIYTRRILLHFHFVYYKQLAKIVLECCAKSTDIFFRKFFYKITCMYITRALIDEARVYIKPFKQVNHKVIVYFQYTIVIFSTYCNQDVISSTQMYRYNLVSTRFSCM